MLAARLKALSHLFLRFHAKLLFCLPCLFLLLNLFVCSFSFVSIFLPLSHLLSLLRRQPQLVAAFSFFLSAFFPFAVLYFQSGFLFRFALFRLYAPALVLLSFHFFFSSSLFAHFLRSFFPGFPAFSYFPIFLTLLIFWCFRLSLAFSASFVYFASLYFGILSSLSSNSGEFFIFYSALPRFPFLSDRLYFWYDSQRQTVS